MSHPRSSTSCLRDPQFQMNSEWEQARGPNLSNEEDELQFLHYVINVIKNSLIS
jgi:hypothetical protein